MTHSVTDTLNTVHEPTAINNLIAASGNPLFKHKFTADPTALIYNDRVYLYTGHDEPPQGVNDYVMNEWLCFSSADLKNWTEHSVPLTAKDFRWAKGDAYASKVIYHQGKFYWYASVTHGTIAGKAIGVAVADNPEGPFHDVRGTALITNDMIGARPNIKSNLDPTAIIDENGPCSGAIPQCYYVKLKESATELARAISTLALSEFIEGACLYKRNGWYYLVRRFPSTITGTPLFLLTTRSI